MQAALRHLAAVGSGLLWRRAAIDGGLTDGDLARAVRAGLLVRVRRGCYVLAELWVALDPVGRHLVMTRAVLAALEVPAVATDVTAAVLLGLDVWGVDLSVVHVVRGDLRSPRLEAGVHHHVGRLDDLRLVPVHGIPVLGPAETVVRIAQRAGFEAGVVCADSALRLGLTSEAELREVHERMRDHPGSRESGRVVGFADGRAESAGESRTRVAAHEGGLPEPDLQVRIYDDEGLIGRADMVIEDLVIEFDGRLKYRRARDPEDRPLKDPGEIVWAEKIREDRMRAVGRGMRRVIWGDLEPGHRPRTIRRLWDGLISCRRRRLGA